jgi:hypothetical protein
LKGSWAVCLLSSGRYKHFQNSHLLLFARFLFNLGVMKANPALLAFVSEELGGTLEVMLIVFSGLVLVVLEQTGWLPSNVIVELSFQSHRYCFQ